MHENKKHVKISNYNKKIIYATEEDIVYKEEENNLVRTWNALSNASESENTDNKGKVYIDTALGICECIEKQILVTHKVRHKKYRECNLKNRMILEGINILEKGIEILEKNIKKEKEISKMIDIDDVILRIVKGKVRIFFDASLLNYVDVDNNKIICNENWVPKGYIVKLKYRDIDYSSIISPKKYDSILKNVEEYFREVRNEKIYVGKNIFLSVERQLENEDNTKNATMGDCFLKNIENLFSFIIRNNFKKEEILRFTCLYLSRVYILNMIGGAYKVIEYSEKILEDGLPNYFFIVKNDDIYKIVRDVDNFKIYRNSSRLI